MKTKKRGKKETKIIQKPVYYNLNPIYMNFKQSIRDLKLIKKYFIFSTVLFFIITLIGAFFPIFFKQQIIELLNQIIQQTQGLSSIELTRFIIANNIKSSFLALALGVFLGLVPLGIIFINAYVLGFVINKSILSQGPIILLKLFPHGIFELPAIFISISLGLRLGLFFFTYNGNNKKQEFFRYIKQSIRIFILIIIPLLVIAGIIEGFLIWFWS